MSHPDLSPPVSARQHEIMNAYLLALDAHLRAVQQGRVEEMYGIKEFAATLHIHPRHLSNTIKQVTGSSPCDIFEKRLVEVAKNLLSQTSLPIAEIAARMTYDPSNFTKFFKRYAGTTPKRFREEHFRENLPSAAKSELLTI